VRKPKTIVYVQDNETAFLAVDVEVSSTTSPEPLLAALGERVLVYHAERLARGSYQARFAALSSAKTPDAAIRKLVEMIESLPPPVRLLWDKARQRLFDVGFQGGLKPQCREYDISQRTLAAMSRVGGSLKVTLSVAPAVEELSGTKQDKVNRPEQPGFSGRDAAARP
jgi:hypothetical protein